MMKENSMQEKMTVDDAMISLAASVVERTHELIADGWVKGRMSDSVDGVPTAFCIHGALNLAMEEVFGNARGNEVVEVLAVAFICDEAKTQYNFQGSWKQGGIPAASFNDNAATKHEDVLSVLKSASKRLWEVGLDFAGAPSTGDWKPSKWAEVDTQSEEAQQFLYATLA
jgi:hypothetical protein